MATEDTSGGAQPNIPEATSSAVAGRVKSEASTASRFSKKSCIRFFVAVASILVAVVAFIVLTVLVLNNVAEFIGEWAEDASDEERAAVIAAFSVAALINNIGPTNGQMLQILVCYLYDWWGFLIIVLSRLFGLAIAFQAARVICRRCGTRCASCFPHTPKRAERTIAFLLAMLETIEERPLQVVTLLLVTPVPHSVVAYILGARADSLSLVIFSVANLISCVKLLFTMFLASQADDVADITSGMRNRATMAITLAGIICGFVALFLMGVMANRKLQQIAEAKHQGSQRQSTTPGSGHQGISSDATSIQAPVEIEHHGTVAADGRSAAIA